MTKLDLIEMYFEKPNWLGTRKCKYMDWWRIDRKGKLRSAVYDFWELSTWEQFNNNLRDYYNEIIRKQQENDISKLNWNF